MKVFSKATTIKVEKEQKTVRRQHQKDTVTD